MEKSLLEKIAEKKREIGDRIAQRMKEFEERGRAGSEEWFSELCYCILTANSPAARCIKIQQELGASGFLKLTEAELRKKLREMGYRFPSRAQYIIKARRFSNIKEIIKQFKSEHEAREWLQKNIDGIGWKEASHFLRNVGFKDIAILDRHILTVMREYGLIEVRPNSLSGKRYLEAEEKLRKIARCVGVSLGELDLYLWYLKTGEILK